MSININMTKSFSCLWPGENFASLLIVNSSLLRLQILSGDSPFCRGWSRDDIAPFWGTMFRVGGKYIYVQSINLNRLNMNTHSRIFKKFLVISYMHTLMWDGSSKTGGSASPSPSLNSQTKVYNQPAFVRSFNHLLYSKPKLSLDGNIYRFWIFCIRWEPRHYCWLVQVF